MRLFLVVLGITTLIFFTPRASYAQNACIEGDADGNGRVTLADYEVWRRIYLGATSISPTSNPLSSWAVKKLYVNPNGRAAAQAKTWATSNPSGAAIMNKVAEQPQSAWFTNEANTQIESIVNSYVSKAAAANAMPVLVAYHIPDRDCGGFSSGGASSKADYETWISNFAKGIGNNPAVVILEPDALINLSSCINAQKQQERLDMLKNAITVLNAGAKTYVYLDAGHPVANPAATMSDRLIKAGIADADGFALNVSNYITTTENVTYGNQISAKVGNKHFVIDTSRNGNGPTSDYQWCNPSGRALGAPPTTAPGLGATVDALLWVKVPGESDGSCNGGPPSGTWWPEYLVQLAQNAGW